MTTADTDAPDLSPEAAKAEALHQTALEALSRKEIETAREGFAKALEHFEAMGDDIERVTGVPVVSITYDGTGAPKNDVIVPFLALRH